MEPEPLTQPTNGQPSQPELTQTNELCVFCNDNNTRICIKCKRHYCILHTSRISPNLCQDCFKLLNVIIEEHFTKNVQVYNVDTDSVRTIKEEARMVRLDGPDYVWYSVAVQQLKDLELVEFLEFHRFMVSIIENTRTTRKVADLDKLRNHRMDGLSIETSTRTKTTKRIKQAKTPRQILIDSGIMENNPAFPAMLAAMEAVLKK